LGIEEDKKVAVVSLDREKGTASPQDQSAKQILEQI